MYSCRHCHWDGHYPIMEREKNICPRCETEVEQPQVEAIVYI